VKVLGAVGVGIGSESPLVVITRRFRPEKVYVVASKESLGRVEDFRVQVEDILPEVKVIVVDPEDLADIFFRLREHVEETPDIVDITSGTKVLAAALFLFGLCRGSRITYVSGLRGKHTGRVLTGSEEVKFLDVSGLAEVVRCKDT